MRLAGRAFMRLQDGADRLAVVVGRRRRRRSSAWLRPRRGRGRRGPGRSSGADSAGGRARLEDRRRGRRFCRRGEGRRGGGVRPASSVVVVRQVQRAFDRRHRRGDRIRRRILFCHRVRLASSASIADGSTNAPTLSPAWPRAGGNAPINHVAVYRRALDMETARRAHPSNVVNASFTMFLKMFSSTIGRSARAGYAS